MTASSSTTARCLSLAVLLLSLAPLGSIYVLLSTLTALQEHSKETVVSMNGEQHSLAEIMEDPQLAAATLEQVWSVVLKDEGDVQQLFRMFSIREATARHLSLILPWIISIFLGVVVPACLSIASFVYRRQDYRQQLAMQTYQKQSQERRKVKLLEKLKYFQRELQQSDKKTNEQQWEFPKAGLSVLDVKGDKSSEENKESSFRWVSEPCAVCLHPYEEGDSVVWSPNVRCRHCYHTDCIVPWLIRKPSKQQLCPCCRQRFVRPNLQNAKHGDKNTRHNAEIVEEDTTNDPSSPTSSSTSSEESVHQEQDAAEPSRPDASQASETAVES